MSGVQSSPVRAVMTDEGGAYSSLHTMAVLSFALGLLSLLSFAPFWIFVWIFPAAAVLTGALALWRITGAPEVWSGSKLARAGIGLGLFCGVGASSMDFYTKSQISKYGRAASDRFMEKIKAGELEAAFWLTMPRDARNAVGKNGVGGLPTEVLEQYAVFRMEFSHYAEELMAGEATCEFETVEQTIVEGHNEYAAVVYKLKSPHEETRILVTASSLTSPPTYEKIWFIRDHKLEYTPHTYATPQSAAGHGHSH